jgi:hypothetical protein
MGSSSQQTQQTRQTTQPWAPTLPALNSILSAVGTMGSSVPLTGTETGALNALAANAAAGNPYRGQIGALASDLFTGGPDRSGIVNDAYAQLRSQLGATAAGDYLDPNKNPFFAQTTQTIANDVQNRLAGMYAGAGRDPVGAGNFGQTLGRGIAEGVAPIYSNAYNTERQNQINAANQLFGAGSQVANLLAGFDKTALANRVAGLGVSDAALNARNYGPTQALAIEAQRRGIPLNALAQLANIVTPIARLGTTTDGTQTTTTEQGFNPTSLLPLLTASESSILGNLVLSDARAKRDIVKVGSLHDGTPVYSYTYLGDPTPRIGLIAQDVERRTPGAVTQIGGRKAVDYRKATARARAIGGLLDNLASLPRTKVAGKDRSRTR